MSEDKGDSGFIALSDDVISVRYQADGNAQNMSAPVTVEDRVETQPKWHPISLCAPALLPFQAHSTERGVLFNGDCLEILPHIENESVHTVFADPPFNLAKDYGEKVNDDLTHSDSRKGGCRSDDSFRVEALAGYTLAY